MIQGWWVLFLTGLLSLSVHAESRQVVIQYQKGLGLLSLSKGKVHAKVSALARVESLPSESDLEVLHLKKGVSMSRALQALRSDPTIRFAEPNVLFYADRVSGGTAEEPGVPNDPEFPKLWGLRNVAQVDPASRASDRLTGVAGMDIGMTEVWESGVRGSRSMLVAVIDSGVDWTHPDLAENIYTNPNEIPGNGIDDDGNGLIDDVHGWNFYSGNANSIDDNNHGTHCAGTIGAVGGNGRGVVGVNWQVSILPVKFLSATGSGRLSDAVAAIRYSVAMGAKVLSNSWGGTSSPEILKTAIEEARDAGVLFIAAAGNDGTDNDVSPHYPSNYDVSNIISVGAHDNRGGRAYFSNWGAQTVHLFAPGVNIWSTYKGGQYGVMSGTSMATPHVAGAAALLWAHEPGLSADQVKERLMRTAQPLRVFKAISGGRLQMLNAIRNEVPQVAIQTPDPDAWTAVSMPLERLNLANNLDETFEISHPQARFVRVRFESFNLENGYDRMLISEGSLLPVAHLTGNKARPFVSDYLEGDRAVIRVKTDNVNKSVGFRISGYDWQ